MCRFKVSSARTLIASVLCLAWMAAPISVQATQTPAGCLPQSNVGIAIFCDPAATQAIVGQNVIVGQTVYYQARLSHGNAGDCAVQGGQLNITTPDGVTTNATLGQVIPVICGSAGCPVGSVAEFKSAIISYKVRAVDIGVPQTVVAPCNPSSDGRIQAKATYTGGVSLCDDNNSCDPTASISQCNPALIAALTVTKSVACTTGQVCDASLAYSSSVSGAKDSNTNPKFCYRLIFSNTGTATLNVTSVVDNTGITFSAPGGLPPGAVVTNFSGVTEYASTVTDTVTALAAQTAQSCFPTSIVAQASATATVVNTPISCEVRFVRNATLLTGKSTACTDCEVTVTPTGNAISVVVRVTNTGGNGQSIQNGTVKVGLNTFNVAGPIAPGASADVTVDTIPGNTTTACLGYTADVEFQGVTTGTCPPINTMCNSAIRVCGVPNVCIVKLVKCLEDGSTEGECETQTCGKDLSQYSPSATGVKNAAFCYGIVINNCGEIPLTDVSVSDNQLGQPLSEFPTSLAVGQSATNFYINSYPGVTGLIRNTATVTGQSTGGAVSANTNAVVNLLNPSIVCEKTVSLNGGPATSGGTVEVPYGSSNDLTFAVIVRNNGNVGLVNVKVIDKGTSGCGASTNFIASLPAGSSVTNVLCTISEITCPPTETTISNVVTVSAEVSGEICSINPECQRITAESTCNNVITLFCRGVCITRTPGYWFNHPLGGENCATLLAAIEANGGKLDLGFVCLPTRDQNSDGLVNAQDALREAESYFPPSGSGATLCGARKKLAFHLIAALANRALFGTNPGQCLGSSGSPLPATLIEDAQAAGACGDLQAIRQQMALLGQFENSGDDADFPEPWRACGGAGGKVRKTLQPRITPIVDCANTTNCGGTACHD